MTRHLVIVIALLLSVAFLAGSTPVQADPDETRFVTCYDLCTGEPIQVPVGHPNTPNIGPLGNDFCLAHVQQKTCVTGPLRSQEHPYWQGGIWKTWLWWNL